MSCVIAVGRTTMKHKRTSIAVGHEFRFASSQYQSGYIKSSFWSILTSISDWKELNQKVCSSDSSPKTSRAGDDWQNSSATERFRTKYLQTMIPVWISKTVLVINLDQTFVHQTTTHEFHIRWTRVGKSSLLALVFIHGTPWRSVDWYQLASNHCNHYSIYLHDHPGVGSSASPIRHKDIANQEKIDLDGSVSLSAEASASLFKHWDLKSPPHIVAHDNDGLVSLRLLLEHKITFASLCLIDVVALGPLGLPFFKPVAENEAVFAAIPDNFIEGFVRAYVKSATYNPQSQEIEDMLSSPWLADGSQGPKRVFKETVQAHNRSTGTLRGWICPCGILGANEDNLGQGRCLDTSRNSWKIEESIECSEAGHHRRRRTLSSV